MGQELPSLFIIGSSATLLFGPHLKQMLSGLYTYSRKGDEPAEIRNAFENLDMPQGSSAGDTSMVLDYLKSLDKMKFFHPDIVLLHVGTHDIKRDVKTNENQVPLELYRDNLEAIADWFRRRKIRLIWIKSGPIDEKIHNAIAKGFHRFEADIEAYNEAAEVILRRNGVAIIDLPGFMKNLAPTDQLLKDHVHFKDDVVKLQAAFIAGYLMNLTRR